MVDKPNHRGLNEWWIQRISAILLLIYFMVLLVFLFEHGHNTFAAWQRLFGHTWMKLASLIALLSMAWHAWIGLWTIFTDYIHNGCVRKFLQTVVILLILAYTVWGVVILWG